MTDASPPPNERRTADGAARSAAIRALQELRFVGQATAEALADAAIEAGDLRDQSVSYLELVEAGVEPGVAAHLRREHSLPWSAGPVEGARLRRRAEHIRHLRDDERAWIAGSPTSRHTGRDSATAAAPDGSGQATDAERAWRRRAPSESVDEADDGHHAETNRRQRSRAAGGSGPPFDPGSYTVPELEEAIEGINDVDDLVALIEAERDGDDRITAIDAVERRLRAIGVDPDSVTTDDPAEVTDTRSSVGRSLAGIAEIPRPRQLRTGWRSGFDGENTMAAFDQRMDAIRNALRERVSTAAELAADALDRAEEVGGRYRQRLTAASDRKLGQASDAGEHSWSRAVTAGDQGLVAAAAVGERHWPAAIETARRYDERVRHLQTEDWRQLSLALLLGLIALSGLAVIVFALRPAGIPAGAVSLFAVTLAVGVAAAALHWWDAVASYHLTLLTALSGLVTAGGIAAFYAGPSTLATTPLTLGVYALIAASLITTTYLSRRDRAY